jgi:raffinose/stachyose/melibiose transport system permease protein
MFVFPVLILFLAFFIVPLVMGMLYSLTDWDGIRSSMQFVGIKNFLTLFADSGYWGIVRFTLLFVVQNVVLTLVAGFLLALSLDRTTKCNIVFRILFFLPNILSPLVAGFVWTFLFNSVLPAGLLLAGLPADLRFLGTPGMATEAIVAVSVWQSVGYVMIIYIAALNSIDKSILESVLLDGADLLTRIRFIIVPLIMPAITVNLFWLLSQSFRLFDLNVALTNGGPGQSTTGMALDIYHEGFARNMMGLASAKALVLFSLVFIMTLIQLKATKSKELNI